VRHVSSCLHPVCACHWGCQYEEARLGDVPKRTYLDTDSLNQKNTTFSADTVMAISAMAVYEVSFPEVKYATHAHTL
jgi:hypothetical protein